MRWNLRYFLEWCKAKKEDIALILSSIYKWKDAWKTSNINEYLSFYSKEFKRADRSDFNTFANQKKQIFAKNENKIINLYNIYSIFLNYFKIIKIAFKSFFKQL